ncbi:2-polyprenylphenol 6-hydroxylase [Kiloniella sp. b19]|uniref:2-polyprenylphenol 6-hydroxylase n=1 Tax=Kiloniella sp. GXU_MW_B19 TaxID=3141326 RepID=UPI0031DB33A0
MIRSLKTLRRLFQIAFAFARHDALAVLEERRLIPGRAAAFAVWFARLFSLRKSGDRPGEKLARALTDLGPTFIKLGQFLSTRSDLLGDQLAADLARLQDQLPPFSGSEARKLVESELGASLDELFESFDPEPVSAASIAQVHFAVTTSGEKVAVKVLRPGADEQFRRDLALFHHLAELLTRTRPSLKRFRLQDVVQTFHDTVKLEMDLRMEAAAACELSDNFAGDDSYDTPSIDWERTSRRVMTMSRVSGIPMDDRQALLDAGHDLEEVLTVAARIFFNQVFRDGFFHGDQHPGNMFVGADGQIVAVDFGIMGRMDRQTRYFLADMLLALLEEDYYKLALAHKTGGLIDDSIPLDTFAQALRSVCQPIMGKSLDGFSFASLLGQMLHLTETFEMKVQPQLLLLQKNMVMAEGVSRHLDQDLNIWTLSRPLIEQWMRENRGPQARVRDGLSDLAQSLERLPQFMNNLEDLSDKLRQGGLKLDEKSIADFSQGSSTTAKWALFVSLVALGFAAGIAL